MLSSKWLKLSYTHGLKCTESVYLHTQSCLHAALIAEALCTACVENTNAHGHELW